jgi:hypothetical protein
VGPISISITTTGGWPNSTDVAPEPGLTGGQSRAGYAAPPAVTTAVTVSSQSRSSGSITNAGCASTCVELSSTRRLHEPESAQSGP